MTKDDIMKLALESGFAKILDEHASEYRDFTFELSQDQYPELGRFVNLVAAHKAEVALAEAYRCGVEAGAVAEREACAEFFESTLPNALPNQSMLHYAELLAGIAAAIRARGNT